MVFELMSVLRKTITQYTVMNYTLLLLYFVHNYIIICIRSKTVCVQNTYLWCRHYYFDLVLLMAGQRTFYNVYCIRLVLQVSRQSRLPRARLKLSSFTACRTIILLLYHIPTVSVHTIIVYFRLDNNRGRENGGVRVILWFVVSLI